jgi:hypothetical protein
LLDLALSALFFSYKESEVNRQLTSKLSWLSIAAYISLATASANADTLLIDAITKAPPNEPSGLLRPSSGQSMEMVLARFGEPKQKLAPVGNPPITRWVYAKFTVYFEHDSVVNSAVHLGPTAQ